MPYKNKQKDREWHKLKMRERRQVVTPSLIKPVTPKPQSIARPELDGDGNPIYDYW